MGTLYLNLKFFGVWLGTVKIILLGQQRYSICECVCVCVNKSTCNSCTIYKWKVFAVISQKVVKVCEWEQSFM